MNKLFNDLFHINRSLAGNENRKSLKILKNYNKELVISSFNSGKKIEGWRIPDEWSVKQAYVINSEGKKIIDYKNNFLHLASYSISFEGYLNTKELKKKIFIHKKLNDAIPYKTLYYSNDWGICISKKQFNNIFKKKDEIFFIKIVTSFKKGKMNYGEVYLKGKSKRELIFSTYICHPNMANNELSGPVLSSMLIKHFKKRKLNYSMRFLFLPETIGSIAYLNKYYKNIKKNFLAGFVLTCLSGPHKLKLLQSRNKNSISEKYLTKSIKDYNLKFKKISFNLRGSDERQYCWPNIDLDFSSIMHSKYLEYDEYHSSLDDLNFIKKETFLLSLKIYKRTIRNINSSIFPKSTTMHEPKMDKYMKYDLNYNYISKIILFLSYCDGKTDIEDISKLANFKPTLINKIFNFCLKKKLITI